MLNKKEFEDFIQTLAISAADSDDTWDRHNGHPGTPDLREIREDYICDLNAYFMDGEKNPEDALRTVEELLRFENLSVDTEATRVHRWEIYMEIYKHLWETRMAYAIPLSPRLQEALNTMDPDVPF